MITIAEVSSVYPAAPCARSAIKSTSELPSRRAPFYKKSCIQFDTRNVIGYNLSVCKAEFA